MAAGEHDKTFAGGIPELYDTHLVPLIFEAYAQDLAARVAARPVERVLEIAAGTGVVSRALAAALPTGSTIVATDLNQPMLDYAASRDPGGRIEWRQADAMSLPFDDGEFDAVVCQFGVMFFPDRAHAIAEARRVLRRSGRLLFNAWDRIEHNEFADVVTAALERIFPDDPPRFLARTPHGYHDPDRIRADVAAGGFEAPPRVETLARRSRAASAGVPAVAYCQGTPLRNEIEARDPARLAEATAHATAEIAARFGDGPVDGKIQAHVVEVERA